MATETLPLQRVRAATAEWIGVPQKIRQAADYIMWGVVVSLVAMIVITAIK